MILAKVKSFLHPLKKRLTGNIDKFLRDVTGIVHVGANTGQERDEYKRHGLNVIWIEPIPHIFSELQNNLRGYERQMALQALVTDVYGHQYEFHIASNNGASSSILEFKHHKDIWPGVNYTSSIKIESTTLDVLFERERIDLSKYQALTVDTQGSELLVLKGGISTLKSFRYIKIEVPDFESYAGCCQLSDVEAFMKQHGFSEFQRKKFATRSDGGSYFDIVYKRAI